MGKDWLGYEQLMQTALRSVVKMALERVALQGLPGAHHFYITFDTRHPEVRLAEYLKTRYPEEMTIVLQHQFWGLKITDDRFEVTLSFNKVGEHIVVPYAAIKAFFDPSVQFGLQFKAPGVPMIRRPQSLPTGATPPVKAPNGNSAAAGAPKADAPPREETKSASGEVVSLDAFRKK
jgi:hypothetical protein